MKNICKFIIILCLSVVASVKGYAAQDTVQVQETEIPLLIERIDNELFRFRIDARQAKVLNNIQLQFEKNVNMTDIAAVKLYYGGTEAVDNKSRVLFAPVDYMTSFTPGKTLAANRSYSMLKAEVNPTVGHNRQLTFDVNQRLFPGINYFWISLQLKPTTSLLTKISARITAATLDGSSAPLTYVHQVKEHYAGIGVRHAGDDGVSAYRIPGLVTTNKGTLLGVYDVRHNSSVDLQEYVDIGLSRSIDKGQTWEKMRIPMSFGENGGLPKSQNGVGDPAILVDKKTGDIWIMAAWTHGMGGGTRGRAWWNSQQGMDSTKTAQLVLVKSSDDGRTWSKPINITQQVKDPSWFFLLQGPGMGISMDDGTLVFAGQYIQPDRVPCACIIYSKDHGKTWHISTTPRVNTTESQVAEIAPGVLMLNMRDNRGGSRAVSITKDMGKTWTDHPSSRKALREPVCMASLIHVKAADNVLKKDLLLFSNPDDVKFRRNITIKASLDGGLTWLPENQLNLDNREGWGYSCLTMIDKETVGILYESSVAHMTFQKIKLRDIIKSIRR